jgi:hypothetical protein
VQLRLKLGAIASAIAILAGLAVAFAVPASAKDDVKLCVTYGSTGSSVYCVLEAVSEGGNPPLGEGGGGASWDAPSTGEGQISYDGSPKYCMEINGNQSDVIREEPCAGKPSEEWEVIGSTTVFGTKTVPAYIYQSVLNSKLCLSAPASFVGNLYALTCNFKDQTQNWMQCSGSCSASS